MLHRLQAQMLRESWSEDEHRAAYASAVHLLGSVDADRFGRNDTEARRQETRNVIEQLRAISAQAYSRCLFDDELVRSCLSRALVHAINLGLPQDAITLSDAVSFVESIAGPSHADALVARNNLAGAYESAGRTDDALALNEQVLVDRSRVLGEDHPDTLTSLNNLAGTYESRGRLTEAITLYEQVLVDRSRVLGEDHPDTLASGNNLAYAYLLVGRTYDAVSHFEQTLIESTHALGENHPSTVGARKNLEVALHVLEHQEDDVPAE